MHGVWFSLAEDISKLFLFNAGPNVSYPHRPQCWSATWTTASRSGWGRGVGRFSEREEQRGQGTRSSRPHIQHMLV